MPVAKLLRAPYVQLCESAPTTSSPGRTRPFSGSTVWQMPPCPTSKYHLMPIWCENSRVRRPRVALAASFAGWKWSCVTATRSGSQIFSAPICSRMILPAGGIVRSWPIAKSTFARTRSPGLTLSRPAPRARIFSVIVIAIGLVPQPFYDGVPRLGRREVASDVARALASAYGGFARPLDRVCHIGNTQVSHHHSRAQNRPDRVDEALPGDVGRRPVDGLEQAASGRWIDVGGRRDAHPADQLSRQVGQDVAEQVAGHYHVELARVLDQLHRRRIDVEMAGFDLGVLGGDSLPAFLPEGACEGHGVGLVDHHDLVPRHLKRVLDDACDAEVRVDVLLDCYLLLRAFLEAPAHADVEALGVLAHDQEVHRPALLAPKGRQPVVV